MPSGGHVDQCHRPPLYRSERHVRTYIWLESRRGHWPNSLRYQHLGRSCSHRVALVKRLLSGGTVRNIDVHARLKNREVWIGQGFSALIEINGEPCVLSLIEGVTDFKGAEEPKQAEATLSSLAGRLIQAQEEERASVARELHHYVDGVLLLSMNLDRVLEHVPESVSESNEQIADAKQQIEDLAMDIQNLSHRLHSSKLEYLGLAAAAASFAKSCPMRKKLKFNFHPRECGNTCRRTCRFVCFVFCKELWRMRLATVVHNR